MLIIYRYEILFRSKDEFSKTVIYKFEKAVRTIMCYLNIIGRYLIRGPIITEEEKLANIS